MRPSHLLSRQVHTNKAALGREKPGTTSKATNYRGQAGGPIQQPSQQQNLRNGPSALFHYARCFTSVSERHVSQPCVRDMLKVAFLHCFVVFASESYFFIFSLFFIFEGARRFGIASSSNAIKSRRSTLLLIKGAIRACRFKVHRTNKLRF